MFVFSTSRCLLLRLFISGLISAEYLHSRIVFSKLYISGEKLYFLRHVPKVLVSLLSSTVLMRC